MKERFTNTELASLIDRSAPQQRSGVLGSLSLVADSFRLLPKKEDAKTEWTAREWSKERKGWIFITSQPAEREALRPLHSLWIDMLVLRLLTAPTAEQHPVWFVLDELASLQKLPQLHTAITENRKSRNPIVLNFLDRVLDVSNQDCRAVSGRRGHDLINLVRRHQRPDAVVDCDHIRPFNHGQSVLH